ncbi:DNA polymerase III subunit delta', partial [Staphylococcus aureus]|nr:DNA polymerase III subunit delta' [Staphylococcus aureus]
KDQVEQVVSHLFQLAFESTKYVYIIEVFVMLTVLGVNSILKFLEVPPDTSFAFFFSTLPD